MKRLIITAEIEVDDDKFTVLYRIRKVKPCDQIKPEEFGRDTKGN